MPYYPKLVCKKMEYPEAPSGMVNVGKYVPPFEPVTNGHGYHGVILEDCKSGKLQCHICGGWYEIFNSHLSKHHGITSNEYRDMFGLSRSTALKSKKIRLRQSEVMIGLRKKHKKHRVKFKKNNLYAGNRKNKRKSAETINKYGVCDLQLAHKVLSLKNKMGKTPTLVDLKNEYGGVIMTHLQKRYGSYIQYCRQLGLEPNFSNHNPKYSREYFIEKALSNWHSMKPTIRIFTDAECRALYKYYSGIEELKREVENVKNENNE